MKIVKAGFEILTEIDGAAMLKRIEAAGRTCYRSEDKITDGSAEKFVAMILKRRHETVIEHESVSARIICDRGISHEIVRHRLASYSQESTRYCNYGNANEITVIDPRPHLSEQAFADPHGYSQFDLWRIGSENAETAYLRLLAAGAKPQMARSVLPNSLKTEIMMTCNLREWRHFFKLRTSKAAHPQMREIAIPMLAEFQQRIPVIFDDIEGAP